MTINGQSQTEDSLKSILNYSDLARDVSKLYLIGTLILFHDITQNEIK